MKSSGSGKGNNDDKKVAHDETADPNGCTQPSKQEHSNPKKCLKQFLQSWNMLPFDRRLEIGILALGVVIATLVLNVNTSQLRQMSEAMMLDQRPWVGITSIQILNTPTEGQSFAVQAPISNTGKSPAINVMQYSVFKLWIKPADDLSIPLTNDPAISHCFEPKPKWDTNSPGGMILPGASDVYLRNNSPTLNKDIFDAMTKRASTNTSSPDLRGIPQSASSEKAERLTLGLYLVGCIDYFDQFKNAHRTGICYFHDPSGTSLHGEFTNCANGNSAD